MKPFLPAKLFVLCLLSLLCNAETHRIVIDQTGHEAFSFGTTVFGIGQQAETAGIWPCNFWSNFSADDFSRDLAALKLEGGNSAILLYPFVDRAADPQNAIGRQERLETILRLADAHGIRLTLRLGYAWDNGFSNNAKPRQTELLVDPEMRERWYQFCADTHAVASPHRSFAGAFVCWEDFWAFLAGAELNEEQRRVWARHLHYPHEILPARREPRMEEYFDHFNRVFANDFFPASQQRFPGLGMEVRLDYDPIFDGDKFLKYYVHEAQFRAPNLRKVYLYWGPFMGARNEGDMISADLAAQLLVIALERAQALSSPEASLIVSQFNYRDNTPGFSHNSRIIPEQVGEFLQKSASILRQYCTGVFTWSNHSYRHNAINNGTFSTGNAFWQFTRALVGIDGDRTSVSVFPGGDVSQHIEVNSAVCAGLAGADSAALEFFAKTTVGGTCLVSIGNKELIVTLKDDGTWHHYTARLDRPDLAGHAIRLTFPQGAQLDDVVVSNHTQLMGPLHSAYSRDVTYAELAWVLTRSEAAPERAGSVAGVTTDNWITSRATFTAPTKAGRYQIAIDLDVPRTFTQQTAHIALRGNETPPASLSLKPGHNRLIVSGKASAPTVMLSVGFSQRQKPVPDGQDTRELAAHLNSVGQE